MPLLNEAGKHKATVRSAVFGESPDKGTPFIEFNFETEKGSISGWLYLSDAAFDRTVRVLRDTFGFDNNFETLPQQVDGKECSITTEFETFEKKERLKVKWINSQREVTPIKDAGALGKFSQRAARVVNEAPKAVTKAPTAAPAPKVADPF